MGQVPAAHPVAGGQTTSAPLDVVCPYGGRGRSAEGFKISLRSLARNVPHTRVWIVGAPPPDWAVGLDHIPVTQPSNKYQATTLSLQVACSIPDISDRFLLWNDDFFVMKPIDTVVPMHRGRVSEVIQRLRFADGRYMSTMRSTLQFYRARGITNPLCYEVHAPMPVDKQAMAAVLADPDIAGRGYDAHKRSLYGNLHDIGGEQVPRDPKVVSIRGGFDPNATFLSTGTWMRTEAIEHIRASFTDPSEYEKD